MDNNVINNGDNRSTRLNSIVQEGRVTQKQKRWDLRPLGNTWIHMPGFYCLTIDTEASSSSAWEKKKFTEHLAASGRPISSIAFSRTHLRTLSNAPSLSVSIASTGIIQSCLWFYLSVAYQFRASISHREPVASAKLLFRYSISCQRC